MTLLAENHNLIRATPANSGFMFGFARNIQQERSTLGTCVFLFRKICLCVDGFRILSPWLHKKFDGMESGLANPRRVVWYTQVLHHLAYVGEKHGGLLHSAVAVRG